MLFLLELIGTVAFAVSGAVVCAVCWRWLGSMPSMLLGAGIILVLRNLASHYRWSLPKIR